MVEVVGIIATRDITQKTQSQGKPVSAPVESTSSSGQSLVSSHIRVDNLQNVAILEYRSAEGEVVQQYPTQAQIESFRRAESLQSVKQQTAQAAETAQYTVGSGGHGSESRPAAPAPHTPTPAPKVSAPAGTTGAPSGDSGSTHSVLA